MNQHEKLRVNAEREICAEAARESGGRTFLTDARVLESLNDPVSLPSTQTQEDTREFCGEHRM